MLTWVPLVTVPLGLHKLLPLLLPHITTVLFLPWNYIRLLEIFFLRLIFVSRGFPQQLPLISWVGVYHPMVELRRWLLWYFFLLPLLCYSPKEPSGFLCGKFQVLFLWGPVLLVISRNLKHWSSSFWFFFFNIQWINLVLWKCINRASLTKPI